MSTRNRAPFVILAGESPNLEDSMSAWRTIGIRCIHLATVLHACLLHAHRLLICLFHQTNRVFAIRVADDEVAAIQRASELRNAARFFRAVAAAFAAEDEGRPR
jgi:hypothetical protein